MRRALAALLGAALLAGCAQLPKNQPTPPALDKLSGRLSVTVAATSQQRSTGGSAGFELTGGPEAGQLTLTSPLGTLAALARWQPGEAVLQTPEQERRFADLDALTRELLGEAVPVAALFDWLRGRPWPQAPAPRHARRLRTARLAHRGQAASPRRHPADRTHRHAARPTGRRR